jgi:hypothetical protein
MDTMGILVDGPFGHSRGKRESRFFFVFSWIPALACPCPLGRNDAAIMSTNLRDTILGGVYPLLTDYRVLSGIGTEGEHCLVGDLVLFCYLRP